MLIYLYIITHIWRESERKKFIHFEGRGVVLGDPNRKIDFGFGSSRVCERARRGEAVWASERHFDSWRKGVTVQVSECRRPATSNRAGCPVVRLFGLCIAL